MEKRCKRRHSLKGLSSPQFNCPTSFSFDFENNLYVVDSRNHRVQRFEVDKY